MVDEAHLSLENKKYKQINQVENSTKKTTEKPNESEDKPIDKDEKTKMEKIIHLDKKVKTKKPTKAISIIEKVDVKQEDIPIENAVVKDILISKKKSQIPTDKPNESEIKLKDKDEKIKSDKTINLDKKSKNKIYHFEFEIIPIDISDENSENYLHKNQQISLESRSIEKLDESKTILETKTLFKDGMIII